MDWKVVVPSYNRVEGFKHKTLATLQYHKIPASKIYLFVANEEQKSLYEAGLEPDSVGHIIVGVKGLPEIRNFIFDYFPKGTPLVSFDDDVREFVHLTATWRRPLKPAELSHFIDQAFAECEKVGARLWGDYPTFNYFYMKPTISYDLKLIVGCFWGCLNPGNEVRITIGHGEKEDFMRTIQFWELDKAIVRFNYIAHKTSVYKGEGGLQLNDKNERLKRERRTTAALLKKWPQYLYLNITRKTGVPELLLKKQYSNRLQKRTLPWIMRPKQTRRHKHTMKNKNKTRKAH